MRGLTLIEILIVCVLVGILAAFALPTYFGAKEKAIDKEAQSNLNLIAAAEKMYRLDYGDFKSYDGLTNINNGLELDLPVPANQPWEYKVTASQTGGSATFNAFIAKARRVGSDARVWCIANDSEEPYTTGCAW